MQSKRKKYLFFTKSPLAHFFDQKLYILLNFLSYLFKKKSGKVGLTPHKPSRGAGLSRAHFCFKSGLKTRKSGLFCKKIGFVVFTKS